MILRPTSNKNIIKWNTQLHNIQVNMNSHINKKRGRKIPLNIGSRHSKLFQFQQIQEEGPS